MNGIFEEIKHTFKQGSMLTRLIYINLAVFLLIKIIDVFLLLLNLGHSNFAVEWLAVPAQLSQLIHRPWTIISYMFLHQGFLHILFNLLWLFWLGKIFLEYFSQKQLLNVYLLGGIAGAFLYILAFNIFPAFSESISLSYALGASAAVYAIIVATAVYVPNYTVSLMFIGQVKLKHIAIVSVILDILLLTEGNAGGHIAHLGGALFGYWYTKQWQKGKDIGKFFGQITDRFFKLFKSKPKMKVSYPNKETDMEYNSRKKNEQDEIDKILEKISKYGYESLSKKEKEILFKQS